MQRPADGPDLFRLEGKAVLITGGSRGIGLAIAEEIARAGADGVVLAARDPEALAAACQRIEKHDTRASG